MSRTRHGYLQGLVTLDNIIEIVVQIDAVLFVSHTDVTWFRYRREREKENIIKYLLEKINSSLAIETVVGIEYAALEGNGIVILVTGEYNVALIGIGIHIE